MRLSASLAAVLVVAAAAATTASPDASDAVRTCTAAQLSIRLVRSAVATGTVGGYIGFTNRASSPCRLTGWPKLVALAPGRATTALHRRSTMLGPRPTIVGVPVVTLRPGRRADAVFAGGDSPGPGKGTCTRPYERLRVAPPGSTRSVVLSAWLHGLGAYLPSCTPIVVTFVVPASALYRG